jgi:hypothetical protein
LREVADARRTETLSDETVGSITRLVDEAAAVADPHRAIDWLSTLPQAVLVALAEPA